MRPLRRPAPAQALTWAFSEKVLKAAEQIRNHIEDQELQGIPADKWFKKPFEFPPVWRAYKAALKDAQDGQCAWCTVCPEDGESHGEQDHIRPTKAVSRALPARGVQKSPRPATGASNSPGYWWRVYDTDNLALTCDTCNNHKLTAWPVARDAARGDWKDEARWSAPDHGVVEYDMVLDPFEPGFDPATHFDLAPNGAFVEQSGDERAEVTIAVVDLNRQTLVKKRTEAAQDIDIRLRDIQRTRGSTAPDATTDLARHLAALAKACSWSSPHALYFRAALGSALSEPSAPFDWPTLRRLWDARRLAPGIDRLPTLI